MDLDKLGAHRDPKVRELVHAYRQEIAPIVAGGVKTFRLMDGRGGVIEFRGAVRDWNIDMRTDAFGVSADDYIFDDDPPLPRDYKIVISGSVVFSNLGVH